MIYLRQYRIIIFVQSRRDFFVRLNENDAGILYVFPGVFGQYDGKRASEETAKAKPVIVR